MRLLSIVIADRVFKKVVDLRGIEPLIPACKAGVLPLALQTHKPQSRLASPQPLDSCFTSGDNTGACGWIRTNYLRDMSPPLIHMSFTGKKITENSRLGLSPYLRSLSSGILYSYLIQTPFELSPPITIPQSTFLSLCRVSWRGSIKHGYYFKPIGNFMRDIGILLCLRSSIKLSQALSCG